MGNGLSGQATIAKREANAFAEDAISAGCITYQDHTRNAKAAERTKPMYGMTLQLKAIQGNVAANHLFRKEILQRPRLAA
jgi:hypothetical protein